MHRLNSFDRCCKLIVFGRLECVAGEFDGMVRARFYNATL